MDLLVVDVMFKYNQDDLGSKLTCYLNTWWWSTYWVDFRGFRLPYGGLYHTSLILAANGGIYFDCAAGVDNNFNANLCNGLAVFGTNSLMYNVEGSLCYSLHLASNIPPSSNGTDIDSVMLMSASTRVSASVGYQFNASFVLVITWADVLQGSNTQLNATVTFQLVLASDGNYTYAFFNYPYGGMKWIENMLADLIYVGVSVLDPHNTNATSWLALWKYQYSYANGTWLGLNPFHLDRSMGNYGTYGSQIRINK
jgi:hypothetical protein